MVVTPVTRWSLRPASLRDLNMVENQRDSVKMAVTTALSAGLRTSLRDRGGVRSFAPPSATWFLENGVHKLERRLA